DYTDSNLRNPRIEEAAGEVSPPSRSFTGPGLAPALGLRAEGDGVFILSRTSRRAELIPFYQFFQGRTIMSLFTWLQNRTRRCAGPRRAVHSSPRRQTAFRPRLEVLEGREVPSTLTVTNNLDNGSVGSLRYETGIAQSGDTIVFARGVTGSI